jgi:hypothetical protein
MLPKIQYNLTNWIDGMKINRQHFIDSENAVIDMLRDANASLLNTYNYGLLQPEPNEKTSLDCNVQYSQSKKFKISVSLCRAITIGGCRIEIIPGTHAELLSDNEAFTDTSGYGDSKKVAGAAYLAVITVDPYKRSVFGKPDAEEYPPRNPFSTSSYRLNLVPQESLNTSSFGAFHLPIARFVVKNDELVRDTEYIPPCAVVAAHPGTKQVYNTIAEKFNRIQECATAIVQKVTGLAQNTPLAQNVRRICEANIWHISSEFFFFRMMYRQQSPIYLANTVVKLANSVNVTLNTIPEKEKEELLQYFSYWNEISPGKFEEMLGLVIDADYEHDNLYEFFQPLLNFLKVWSDLMDKLKDLKLIGQKNEKFDFGGRTMETQKTKEKGKFSIFD